MKKIIFVMAFLLTACGGQTYPYGTPTPTPNPGEIALQMVQQQMAANATAQVVGVQFTATAQIIGATATQQAFETQSAITQQARIDAQATSAQTRRDAEATAEQKRQDAQATQERNDAIATAEREQVIADGATQQARTDALSTQSAYATSTFTVMTLTAIPPHATLTQMAVDNQIAINTQEVERSALSLKQARDTNVIQWLIPTAIAIFGALVAALYIYNQSQIREVKDEDGKVEVLVYKNRTMAKPALFTGPVLDLNTNSMPMLGAPKEQADVTRRAQAIEALAAMPVQPTASGAGAFNDAFSAPQKREDAFEIVEAEGIPPSLLDGETLKVLNNDWKEAHDK